MKRRLPIPVLVLFIMTTVALWLAPPAWTLPATNAEQPAVASQDQQPAQTQVVAQRKSQKKPWYKSRTAKIVGGSAGAGAVVGGLVGGGKGAAAGAVVGGGAGYIYDQKTRKK